MFDENEMREQIIASLKEVYDPEIPVNIYDLGFIYGIDISDDGNVRILMTLTIPGCPIHHFLFIKHATLYCFTRD